jgi:signal transduction histidine kinase
VVEIDKDPTRLKEAIRRGQAIVWLCLLAAEALIFLTLYWLARRATVVMRDQQRRLVDSEKLTVIGEMSLALAHGIRNPLAAIRSSAEIAIDDVPESARKPLRDIITQADRLGAWLRDLLQYSRPEPGRPQPVCIQDLVRECVDGYEARFAQAGITVKVVRSEGGIPLVATDRPLILQAFNSIISNAMEAMQGGGMLTITCGLDADERAVVVSFSDTGPGMTPERLAQAFQPFRTSKPRGLGIGLSLVKSTLERYGGHVHIDSRPGEGTRVELSIPLRGSPR